MLQVKNIRTPQDIERHIEGIVNDFDTGIATKEETIVAILELVVHIFNMHKK
jgi:hypothetical protein